MKIHEGPYSKCNFHLVMTLTWHLDFESQYFYPMGPWVHGADVLEKTSLRGPRDFFETQILANPKRREWFFMETTVLGVSDVIYGHQSHHTLTRSDKLATSETLLDGWSLASVKLASEYARYLQGWSCTIHTLCGFGALKATCEWFLEDSKLIRKARIDLPNYPTSSQISFTWLDDWNWFWEAPSPQKSPKQKTHEQWNNPSLFRV